MSQPYVTARMVLCGLKRVEDMVCYENNCHNCEVCIGCGRNEKRPVLYCDRCGELITGEFAFQIDLESCYCLECAKEIAEDRMDKGDPPGTEPYPVTYWLST